MALPNTKTLQSPPRDIGARSNQRDSAPLAAQMLQSMEENIATLTGAMGAMESSESEREQWGGFIS